MTLDDFAIKRPIWHRLKKLTIHLLMPVRWLLAIKKPAQTSRLYAKIESEMDRARECEPRLPSLRISEENRGIFANLLHLKAAY
jgi:hypothetical protein